MFITFQNILTEMSKFDRLHNANISYSINRVRDLRMDGGGPKELWAIFVKYAGVYAFINVATDEARYIGKSDSDVGARVYHWLYKHPHMSKEHAEDDFLLIATLKEYPYLSSALETLLIEKFSPTANKIFGNKRIDPEPE